MALAITAGVLTIGIGLALALIGVGFANPTAAGTGLMAAGCGIWTLLAARGFSECRRRTQTRLLLAWGMLLLAVILDGPATASGAVVWLFLLPNVSVPVGLAWSVVLLGFGFTLCSGLLRGQARRQAHAAPAVWGGVGLIALRALPFVVLAGLWWGFPQLLWHFRGREIERLAQHYAASDQGPTRAGTDFGACTMAFLGYELTQHGAESASSPEARQQIQAQVLADASAELASLQAAGAQYVRVGASGDHLLTDRPDQETMDDRYMAAAKQTGMGLVLVDTQHPKVTQKSKLSWSEFCRFQRQRIEYYSSRYQPDVYFVVCEPLSYHQFILSRGTSFSSEAWTQQLTAMCRLVKTLRPKTRTGICLLVMPDHLAEWEIWSGMRDSPELDILAVEIYAPDQFAQTEERLRAFGHPREAGKAFWIAETYNGWALCGDRRWDQDAAWLHLAASFAQRTEAETVLVWSFGTFIPGGSFWDFGRGRLDWRWRDTGELSLVGRTFAELSEAASR